MTTLTRACSLNLLRSIFLQYRGVICRVLPCEGIDFCKVPVLRLETKKDMISALAPIVRTLALTVTVRSRLGVFVRENPNATTHRLHPCHQLLEGRHFIHRPRTMYFYTRVFISTMSRLFRRARADIFVPDQHKTFPTSDGPTNKP